MSRPRHKRKLHKIFSGHDQHTEEIHLEVTKAPRHVRYNARTLSKSTQSELDNLLAGTKTEKRQKVKQSKTKVEQKVGPNVIIPKRQRTLPSAYIVNLKKSFVQTEPYIEEPITQPQVNEPIVVSAVRDKATMEIVDYVAFTADELNNQLTHGAIAELEARMKLGVQHVKTSLARKMVTIVSAIVLFVIAGLGWQVYEVYSKKDALITHTQTGLQGINNALTAIENEEFEKLESNLAISTREFLLLQKEINTIPFVYDLLEYIPTYGSYVQDGRRLLDASIELSLAGKFAGNILSTITSEQTPKRKLELVHFYAQQALPHLERGNILLQQTEDTLIPNTYKHTFNKAKAQLPTAELLLRNYLSVGEFLNILLGTEGKKRYLVVFQNNTEIRGSGGFMGSYALVDILNGEIVNLEVPGGGTYDLKGTLYDKIASPEPLQLIAPHWQFQDSNWFVDFPTSAQKIEWFYEKSGGPTVDGVIAVNLPVMERMLEVFGEVELPQYNKTVTAETFWNTVQEEVELDYDKEENKPKAVIGDLANILLVKLETTTNAEKKALLLALLDSLQEKDIQIFSNNTEIQQIIAQYDWAGHIKETPDNYLMVANTNIAGGKTDRVIEQNIHHRMDIQENGEIYNTLKISREHTGNKGDLFTGIQNVNYMRTFIPENAIIHDIEGFSIPEEKYFKTPEKHARLDADLEALYTNQHIHADSESTIWTAYGKDVIGNWTMTEPQNTSDIIIRYTTQTRFDDTLEMLYQKQSGSSDTHVTVSINLPVTHVFAENQQGSLTKKLELSADTMLNLPIERKDVN